MIDPAILIRVLDLAGIYVFALSGGMVAVRNDMDVLGVVVVSFFPAIGGGTLRDLLLDVPVFWLTDPVALMVALLGGLSAFFASSFWARVRALVWIDAVGLALFAMVGAQKAASLGHGFFVTIIMGAITATAGGLIRDVVCGEKTMLLREDIYASAALAGGAVFWACQAFGLDTSLGLILGAGTTMAIRAVAIHFKLNLPKPRQHRR